MAHSYQYPTTEGLQHISNDPSGLYHDDRAAYQRDGMQAYDKQALAYSQAPEHYVPPETQPTRKRVCGLSKKMFIIVLVVLLIVIAGALGGGVGGALASKNSNKAAAE